MKGTFDLNLHFAAAAAAAVVVIVVVVLLSTRRRHVPQISSRRGHGVWRKKTPPATRLKWYLRFSTNPSALLAFKCKQKGSAERVRLLAQGGVERMRHLGKGVRHIAEFDEDGVLVDVHVKKERLVEEDLARGGISGKGKTAWMSREQTLLLALLNVPVELRISCEQMGAVR